MEKVMEFEELTQKCANPVQCISQLLDNDQLKSPPSNKIQDMITGKINDQRHVTYFIADDLHSTLRNLKST